MTPITFTRQKGVFILEALIGIIIFSIGILAMIALQTTAISVQADAQYRIEAANLADRMMGEIALNVNRTSAATIQTSLANFAHRTTTTAVCSYSGADSTDASVVAWATAINTTAATRLPGSSVSMQQILVNTGTFNQVTITICWQGSGDRIARRHTMVSYVN